MDGANSPHGPLIGVVVLVHPKKKIHVTFLRLEDYPAIILVNADGAQVIILGALDFLVVVGGGGRICSKLVEEATHFFLLLLRQSAERRQKISPEGEFDVM